MSILRLNILSVAERDTVKRTFNATDMAPSQLMHAEETMHGAFEHWAATRPDAMALVYGVRGHGCGYPSPKPTLPYPVLPCCGIQTSSAASAASSKQQATSSKQQAASSKQQAASSKQQPASSKQQAASSAATGATARVCDQLLVTAY